MPPTAAAATGASPAGPALALVVPTNEELVIARDTARLVARWLTRRLLKDRTAELCSRTCWSCHGDESGLTSTSLGLVRGLDRNGVNVGFYKPLTRRPTAARSGRPH